MSDLSCPGVGYMYVRKWSRSSVVDALEQKFGYEKSKMVCSRPVYRVSVLSVLSGPIVDRVGSESDVSVLGARSFLARIHALEKVSISSKMGSFAFLAALQPLKDVEAKLQGVKPLPKQGSLRAAAPDSLHDFLVPTLIFLATCVGRIKPGLLDHPTLSASRER